MKDPLLETVNLVNLARGAAIERWDMALEEVLKNIADINTDAKKAREINLKVKFVPNEDRDEVGLLMEVSTKLVSLTGVTTTLHVGRIGGVLHALESNPKQQSLFDPDGEPAVEVKALAAPAPREEV